MQTFNRIANLFNDLDNLPSNNERSYQAVVIRKPYEDYQIVFGYPENIGPGWHNDPEGMDLSLRFIDNEWKLESKDKSHTYDNQDLSWYLCGEHIELWPPIQKIFELA